MMNDFYTYAYLREDRTPYYIGKGKGNRIHSTNRIYKAPKDKSRIIFLKQNLTEEEAFKHEKYMIAVLGRKDNGTGILRNMTDGGDGVSGWVPSEEFRKKAKERMSGSKNNKAKNILIININGENYIVCGEFIEFCKSKNLPLEGIRKRIQRGSKTPTKCGWYAFDITNKSESEVEELKDKFILKYKIRFNLNLIDIEIPPDIQVANKSVNLVFNFIKEKIENEYDITYYNNKKYTKITEEEFKKSGVSAKTAYRAIKVLKENNIIEVEKLNKSNFNQSNYYSL
jgi:hypothetical protein